MDDDFNTPLINNVKEEDNFNDSLKRKRNDLNNSLG